MLENSLGKRVTEDLDKIMQANSHARSGSRGDPSPSKKSSASRPRAEAKDNESIKFAFGQRVETAAKVPLGT